jgi:hypothetical protein
VAQSIITFMTLKDLDENNPRRAMLIFTWAMDHMLDEKGYFYYQIRSFFTNRISYMRWSQAWMLLAFATLLEKGDQGRPDNIAKRHDLRTEAVT